MGVFIKEKPQPRNLCRNELRQFVAYKVVAVPDTEDNNSVINFIAVGDIVVSLSDSSLGVFNATQEKYVTPHRSNMEWRKYGFKRARYVERIQLTFDPDED